MGCCLSSAQEPSAAHSSALPTAVVSVEVPTVATTTHTPSLALRDRFNRPLQRVQWTAQKPVSYEKLRKARNEFWDTRVTGREEIWSALRMAIEVVESDLQTAQQIIDASGITVPTGDLSKGVYDENGNCYVIPQYCISDPTNVVANMDVSSEVVDVTETVLSADATKQMLGDQVTVRELTLRARLSDSGGHDMTVKFLGNDTVSMILRRIAEQAEVHLLLIREIFHAETSQISEDKAILTMAYLGKVLLGNKPLLAQGWKNGNMVNVLVRSL